MATYAKQVVNLTGLTPAYTAVTATDNFTPDADTFLHVKNGGASPDTVVVVTPGIAPGGLAIADVSVSVPAGSERMIGPFPAEQFADPANTVPGNAGVTHSFTTSVTVACIQAPRGT
jgi:hypothetical protein